MFVLTADQMVGLVLQLIFFGIFLTISLIFFRRVRSNPSYLVSSTPVKHNKRSWQTLLKFLFLSAALIIFRCVFRIIEFAQGDDGYLMKKEVFIYIFDAAPMLIVPVELAKRATVTTLALTAPPSEILSVPVPELPT